MALHGDTGKVYTGNAQAALPYNLTFTTGDVIGVVLNRITHTLTYVKNGLSRGIAVWRCRSKTYYPCIGSESPGAKITVNFGSRSFKNALLFQSMLYDVRMCVAHEIHSCPSAEQGRASHPQQLVLMMVLDHLIHMCCWQSAVAVARVLANLTAGSDGAHVQVTDADVDRMCKRQHLLQLVSTGDLEQVPELIEALAPGMLASPKHLHVRFALHLQGFVELLRSVCNSPCSNKDDKLPALQFARAHLGPLDRELDGKQLGTLREALTLLAYASPMESPAAHLFQEERRHECAELVNSAIMTWCGKQPCSELEQMFRQLAALHGEMKRRGVSAAQVIDVESVLRDGLPRLDALCVQQAHPEYEDDPANELMAVD